MNVEYSKCAVKYLNKLESNSKIRLKKAFEKLSFMPPKGDISQMRGHKNLYRLRIGGFRVLFSVYTEKNIILINEIDTRGDIYKNL